MQWAVHLLTKEKAEPALQQQRSKRPIIGHAFRYIFKVNYFLLCKTFQIWLIVLVSKNNFRCVLPRYPEDGNWKFLDDGEGKPGDRVSAKTVIVFECYSGFKLSIDNPSWVCDGKWRTLQVPECEGKSSDESKSNSSITKRVDLTFHHC